MTRTFMWVLATVALVAGAVVATRHFGRATDDGSVRAELAALKGELAELRAALGSRDRAAGQTAARLAFAPQLAAAPQPKETVEEEEARVEREGKAQAIKEAEYYARLDRELRLGRPAPDARAQLQKNVDAVRGRQPAALTIDNYDCAQGLCRVEVRRVGDPDAGALMSAVRHLTRGMAEVSMRPFDGSRSVIYAAPAAHKLPPVDL